MGHEVNSKVQPSPGEALRRLREFVAHLWDECHDGGDFERTADAQKLDTLLAHLSGPVDASGEPTDSAWLSNEQVDAIDGGRRLRAVAAYNVGIADKQ